MSSLSAEKDMWDFFFFLIKWNKNLQGYWIHLWKLEAVSFMRYF